MECTLMISSGLLMIIFLIFYIMILSADMKQINWIVDYSQFHDPEYEMSNNSKTNYDAWAIAALFAYIRWHPLQFT